MTAAATENPHGASIKSMVPDGWYVISDAALLVGKSEDTLRRWRREDIFVPSGHMTVGETKMIVYLYSEEDIRKMKRLSKTIRPGRKPNH